MIGPHDMLAHHHRLNEGDVIFRRHFVKRRKAHEHVNGNALVARHRLGVGEGETLVGTSDQSWPAVESRNKGASPPPTNAFARLRCSSTRRQCAFPTTSALC